MLQCQRPGIQWMPFDPYNRIIKKKLGNAIDWACQGQLMGLAIGANAETDCQLNMSWGIQNLSKKKYLKKMRRFQCNNERTMTTHTAKLMRMVDLIHTHKSRATREGERERERESCIQSRLPVSKNTSSRSIKMVILSDQCKQFYTKLEKKSEAVRRRVFTFGDIRIHSEICFPFFFSCIQIETSP